MLDNYKKDLTKVIYQHIIAIYQQKYDTQERGDIMAKQENGYTLESIKETEKWCQLLQQVPDERRLMFSVSVFAYMNGFEAGIALERNEQAQTTG